MPTLVRIICEAKYTHSPRKRFASCQNTHREIQPAKLPSTSLPMGWFVAFLVGNHRLGTTRCAIGRERSCA